MRVALVISGALIAGYALTGLVAEPGAFVFLVAVLLVNDAVFLPLVIAVGALVRRLPRWLRTAALVAGVLALPVFVVGLPLALGRGRSPDNPSARPLPYGRNLLLMLAAVVTGTLCGAAVRRIRKGTESSPGEAREPPAE